LLAVDEEGYPLTRCMIWADNRAGLIADELRQTARGRMFYERTGVPIHAMTPLCKLLWLRENEPQVFNKSHKFIGIKEYIFFHLFGEFIVDSSVASASGLLNIRSLQWDEDILEHLGIDHSRLGLVVPPRHRLSYHAPKTGRSTGLSLPSDTAIVIGGSDGALANLATGATGDHAMAITIGTSGAARMVIQGVETDKDMRTFCYHVEGNCYILGGASNNGAVVLQWLKETALEAHENYAKLFNLAGQIEPGAEGLLCLPYILGERAPIWNSKAKGIYFGLGIGHTKGHLIRATLEGVIFGLYSIGKILMEKKEVRELHATGGFVRSPLWLQILADVFNIRVLVFGEDESSALGAVMIGREALGSLPSFIRKPLDVYVPDASAHAVYCKQFGKFERIYQLIKMEFNN
jgi:gluconokinase